MYHNNVKYRQYGKLDVEYMGTLYCLHRLSITLELFLKEVYYSRRHFDLCVLNPNEDVFFIHIEAYLNY